MNETGGSASEGFVLELSGVGESGMMGGKRRCSGEEGCDEHCLIYAPAHGGLIEDGARRLDPGG